jgi:capsular polysaccharide biosynthesis protein
VIGPHGAGFTNCVFVPKRAKIMELFPKNRTLDFYSTIAQVLDQDYAKIEGPIQRTFQDKSADFGDFLIDQDEFTTQLDRFFG